MHTHIQEAQLTQAGQYRWTIPRSTLPAKLPPTITVIGQAIPRCYPFHLIRNKGRSFYSCPGVCDTISTV